ncbi:hypothetical protein [Bacillus sp. Brlt_9]|uniref:hypothetical protein n=1 Tax=Bacillus sp. Brlt_9 TaxID=3110916 RepID=UPI003F7C0241
MVRLVGKLVNNPEIIQLHLEALQRKKSYQSIISELKNQKRFEENNLSIHHCYEYITVDYDSNDVVSRVISLSTPNNDVIVDYIESKSIKAVTEVFNGFIVQNNVTKGIRVQNGEVEPVFTRGIRETDLEFKLNVPIDQDFDPENGIRANSLIDFCIHDQYGIKYNHCGRRCGDGTDAIDGGGELINKIDGCCRNHDSCYGSDRNNRCCDKELVNCVYQNRNEDYSTYLQILACFGWAIPLCK